MSCDNWEQAEVGPGMVCVCVYATGEPATVGLSEGMGRRGAGPVQLQEGVGVGATLTKAGQPGLQVEWPGTKRPL